MDDTPHRREMSVGVADLMGLLEVRGRTGTQRRVAEHHVRDPGWRRSGPGTFETREVRARTMILLTESRPTANSSRLRLTRACTSERVQHSGK